jgi:cytochrome c oxidase subunit 2
MVVCNEYCGTSHHNMAGVIHVTAKAVAVPAPPVASAAHPGRDLLENYACTACHSLDGSEQTAATFKGLYGSTRVLADGSSLTATDDYLRESIQNPGAKIVKGFENNMPEMPISEEEINTIIDYLKTLR